MRGQKVRHSIFAILIALVSVCVSLLAAEGIAQVYAYHIIKQGKLYEPDNVLGWKVKPHLDITRLNADGELWHIRTNERGNRAASSWDERALLNVLILGDSFAFGEGVNIGDRFDTLILRKQSSWSVINLGVSGYGTDQEMISARRYFPTLKRGDIVIMLSHRNDFHDILKRSHSGRAKPWFELTESGLLQHQAALGWKEILRDKSYIFSKLMSLWEHPHTYSKEDIKRAGNLYYAIIESETRGLPEKGVHIIIAYHGIQAIDDDHNKQAISNSLEKVCSIKGISCLSLDQPLLQANNGQNFLKGMHWNKNGNQVVAQVLGAYLSEMTDSWDTR